MSIDWDGLIKDAESSLAKALTARVVAGIVASVPWLGAVSGPVGFIIGLAVGQLVKWGDWVTYYVGDRLMNSVHGDEYQKAGEALKNLPPTATKEEIDAAKKAKASAFDRLMGAT
jgi:hypothetical protein